MKKALIGLSIFCLFSVSCNHRKDNSDKFTVTILPVKYIAERIIGDDFAIEVLVSPGSSPETYEPTPQQLISLNDSRLVFSTGLLDLETAMVKKSVTKDKIVNLSKGIDLIEGVCDHSNVADKHSHGIDPHIWTSPQELKTMATNAYEAISLLYPDSVKYYNNYIKLVGDIEELDRITAESINSSEVKCFLIYHPAYTYYARSYGIAQVAIEDEGKEPSAEQIRHIVDLAKENNIKTVLYQKEFSRSVVETICRDIGAVPTEIDPLAEDIYSNVLSFTRLITSNN